MQTLYNEGNLMNKSIRQAHDKPVILTGLRATNDLHIGNYFGAVMPLIDMAKNRSDEYQVNLMVADIHSITTPIDHTKLYEQIINNLRMYIAAGLPTDKPDVYLYRQSFIPPHSELTVILNSFTGVGEMNRMTQFKDKSARFGEAAVTVGLFDYPVLMACDILLYNATYVPVGDDQSQHLEYTRDIASRMNNRFEGGILTVPQTVAKQHEFFGKDQGLRIKDLLEPDKKMSKTATTDKGTLLLSDTPEAAAKKVMSATTDSFGEIKFDLKQRPGISNLLQILALLGGQDLKAVIAKYEGQTSYGDLKKDVAQAVSEFLKDFQAKLTAVDDATIHTKLQHDEEAMRKQANQTLLKVQTAVGLRPKA